MTGEYTSIGGKEGFWTLSAVTLQNAVFPNYPEPRICKWQKAGFSRTSLFHSSLIKPDCSTLEHLFSPDLGNWKQWFPGGGNIEQLKFRMNNGGSLRLPWV